MNEQNLQPVRTKTEARERGRAGGLKAGVLRRQRKTFAEGLKMFLKQKDDDGVPFANKIHLAMLRKAIEGDVKATEYVRDTIGEKPGTNIEHSGGLSMEIRWLDEDEDEDDG